MFGSKKEIGEEKAEEVLWKKLAHGKPIESKEELLKASEISLILDTYDDIFSDFDPRPFHSRALSDDFLQEMKRATRSLPSGMIELKLLMPHNKRVLDHEVLIKRRLRDHFKKHYLEFIDQVNGIRNKALMLVILGVFIMVGAAFASFYQSNNFLSHLIVILLEPAGWFTFWTGLDEIYYNRREKKPDLSFYEKMSQTEITFLSY